MAKQSNKQDKNNMALVLAVLAAVLVIVCVAAFTLNNKKDNSRTDLTDGQAQTSGKNYDDSADLCDARTGIGYRKHPKDSGFAG